MAPCAAKSCDEPETLKALEFLWVIVVAVAMVSGCSTLSLNQREVIDTLVIHNMTSADAENVVLHVSGTQRSVGTSRILPFRSYTLGFPAVRNERAAATLSWTHRNQEHTRVINTIVPPDIATEKPLRVVIRIENGGGLSSRIE